MKKLDRAELMSLEKYAAERKAFRAQVIAHKRHRTVHVGPHLTLHFEDRLTIQYQVQEMLRIERIFEPAGIEDELAAYNPLIPDGGNLKATMLVEYADPDERRRELARLKGIEGRVWIGVDGGARIYAIADEDLDRENEEKTSAVHFLRFELDEAARKALRAGAKLAVGVDHPAYAHAVDPVPESTRVALAADLD